MGPARNAVPPLVVAASDLGVGSLLYHQGSHLLGILLLVCGLSVLITAAWDPLNLVGSVLWRRFLEGSAE